MLWSADEMASSAINKTGYIYVLLGPFMFQEMETTSWLGWHRAALSSVHSESLFVRRAKLRGK